MKNSTKAVIFVSVLLLLLASSYSLANAGFINAGVTLSGGGDDFFTIYTSGDVNITWILDDSQFDSAYASLGDDYEYDYQNNWTTGTDALVANETQMAHGQTLESSIEASINTESAKADAWAERYGHFQVSGSGIVSFALDYQYSIDFSHSGTLWLQAGLSLSKSEFGNIWSGSSIYESLSSEWDGSGPFEDNGTLVVSMFFNDGEEGYIGASADVYATPAVPLPSAIWMFASGIVGLVGIGRKVC